MHWPVAVPMASGPAASRRTRDRRKSAAANNLSQYEQGVRYQALSTQFQKRAEDSSASRCFWVVSWARHSRQFFSSGFQGGRLSLNSLEFHDCAERYGITGAGKS